MPDIDLNSTLTALRRDTDRVGMPNAADVRHRGDQRTHRTIAATGLTAALVLIAAAIGFTGLGNGNNRANELPAAEPISEVSLLIPAEVGFGAQPTFTDADSVQDSISYCQRGDLADLGGAKTLHRRFDHTAESGWDGQQVAIQFASPDRAVRAFDTIDTWFEECPNLDGQMKRWPMIRAGAGQAQTVEFYQSSRGETPQSLHEFSGYGINGDVVTIVSLRSAYKFDPGTSMPDDVEALKITMQFALQRLDGTRKVAANAVPAGFRFAVEDESPWREHPQEQRRDLAAPWWACFSHMFTSVDGLRTGMVTADGTEAWSRNLALFDTAAAAATAGEELQSLVASCRTDAVTTVATSAGPQDVYVSYSDSEEVGPRAWAVAVVQMGNGVYVAEAGFDLDGKASKEQLMAGNVQLVRDAINKDHERVCAIATGC